MIFVHYVLALHVVFHLLESGPVIGRYCPSREFDADDGVEALGKGDQRGLYGLEYLRVLLVAHVDIGGEGLNESVGDEDAQKGADEGSRHFLADLFGRPADGLHGDDNAEHRGDYAESGHGIAYFLKDHARLRPFVVMGFDVRVHEGFHVMGRHASEDDEPEGVAHEREEVVLVRNCG